MYSVVLAAMLTAGPATAPAWSHMSCHGCCGGYNAFSSSCCCGGYTPCCGGYTSCCGGYAVSYSCCGGYTACCGGHQSYWGGYASCCCGGHYASWSGYNSCCGGYSSCCGGWYSAYSSCCGGYTPCCGGMIVVPSTGTPDMPKAPEIHKDKEGAARPTTATVIVKAPLDVHITVNGQRTERTTAEQTFTTPDLEPGKAYSYDIRAEAVRDGKTLTATKKVIVQAGVEVQADFSDLSRSDSSAHVTIKAPADARVTVDGVEVPVSARSFNTPALEAGREYYYTVKMEATREGRKVAESQRVVVEAGKDVAVEFNEAAVTTAGK